MILKLITGLLLSVTSFAAVFQYGGIKHDITSQTATPSVIVMNAASTQVQRITGSSAQDIKLPDATTLRSGYWYHIINESSGAVTIRNSSSTLLGTLSVGSTTTTGWAKLYLTSNSTSGGPWTITQPGGSSGSSSSGTIGSWASETGFTYSGGFGTVTGSSAKCRQVGENLECNMFITTGTVTGTTVSFSLPTTGTFACTVDTTALPTTTGGRKVGHYEGLVSSYTINSEAGGSQGDIFYDDSDTANLYLAYQIQATTYGKIGGSSIFGNAEKVNLSFSVPCTQF